MVEKLKLITNQFCIEGIIENISTLNSGHINSTYLVTTNTNTNFVLQKLNSYVFKDVVGLIENKIKISELINKRLKVIDLNITSAQFVKSERGDFYVKDKEQNYWNLQNYIPDAITFDKAPNKDVVFEAGKLYGSFLVLTANASNLDIKETLKDFHSVPLRLNQFNEALLNASEERKKEAQNEIDFVVEHQSEMCKLATLKNESAFPIRVTHNDTKLSNALFDKNNKGLAIIDLDTVMPGIVHFDFGDSIRSICSNAEEDNDNFDTIAIQLDYYKAYCKGYAIYTQKLLTKTEIKYLPLGIKTIIYIMGLRFLTDFLNNDKYYKTAYKNHNLVRTKNQFALVKSVIKNYNKIITITNAAFDLKDIS
ncbi:phosphotransferase enzyme family protein [Lacinutrix jangbogonensis]|uniref:phosphotransferase enzyme family protein n=1 Tax=Lacinutrix jangbogonensis TaxID=1469557 RepID=UPI00053CFECB|nr:aminoglycoside phosphotransferase family protein [Lacinutrix jangbogonensis]